MPGWATGGACRRSETPDLENVADFFREHPSDAAIDDRTWTDLLMDDVFAHLDRTESRVGQQMLYRRLRGAGPPQSLDAFEALVARFTDDMAFRAQTQSALVRLSHSSVYYLHRLVRPDTLNRPWWYAVFPVWTAAMLTTLILGVVWHGLFVFAIFGLIVNVAIRVMTNRRVGSEAVWFRQVGPLMSVARALAACETPATAAITGGMAADRAALRRLGAIARWVSRGNDAGASTDLIGAVIEYINIQLLMDVNALYFASRELRTRGAHFVRLIEAVGDIDAAIAVASFRASAAEWVRPRFVAPQMPAVLTDLRHPLVDDAVPKFDRACPAARRADHRIEHVRQVDLSAHRRRERRVGADHPHVSRGRLRGSALPRAQLHRAGGRSGRGKSYYLVEVESVLSLVAASGRSDPHLFIFDELFRGTNAVERIAAGEAVLRALAEGGQPHVVLAATHDGELVELLHDSYVVFHLGDAIGPGGLSFDYRLTPGPATSRNAIALLKLNGAPASLVEHALSRAAELDRRRAATTSGH